MMFKAWRRSFREGAKGVWRNGSMSFASVSTVSISLFLLGLFLLLLGNVNQALIHAEDQLQVKIYLELAAPAAAAPAVERMLRNDPEVKEVVFVPKDEGLQRFRESLDEWGDLLEGLERENPLPDAFFVRTFSPQQAAALSVKATEYPYVEEVDYGQEYVEPMLKFTNGVRWIGFGTVLTLAVTALFLIANTIRATIISRQREIEIMRLVGATRWFIRGPFLVEGMLMGFIGALFPALLLGGGYAYLLHRLGGGIALFQLELLPLFPVLYQMMALLLAMGVVIGLWGSLISMHRFLRL